MDIKRTVLWVVFSMSLLLLWDSWMRYNGKPSMFFPTPVSQVKQAPAPVGNGKAEVPQATAVNPANSTPAAVPGEAAPAKSEIITVTTDLFKAEIDALGGELVRLELLQQKDTADPKKHVVLFDHSAARTYLAQTGLIGGQFPNHKSPFVAKPGPRMLDSGNQVQVVLESEQGGL